jgi:putative Mn2+ efflux pump MntP
VQPVQLLNISAIAVALAMDAFAVAIAAGVMLKKISFRQNFRLAWHFGLFQAIMPVLGWSAGLSIRDGIADYDHWVAFGLLAFVAQGMLRGAFKKETNENERKDPTRGLTMVMLSVATSIDALAVGLSLSMISISIWTPALIIGLVAGTFTTVANRSQYSTRARGLGISILIPQRTLGKKFDCGNAYLALLISRQALAISDALKPRVFDR